MLLDIYVNISFLEKKSDIWYSKRLIYNNIKLHKFKFNFIKNYVHFGWNALPKFICYVNVMMSIAKCLYNG